jgi:ankyrin repeat protein
MDVPAQTIVDLGADCNRSENDGWTALHFAASSGFDEIVEILLKVGTYLSGCCKFSYWFGVSSLYLVGALCLKLG